MLRRTFLKSAAALTTAGVALADAAPPNIVLILADDLGYGDLESYGSRNPTPNLTRLAEDGVQFSNYYSASPVCSPARAALLTGRYGVRCGVPGVFFATDPGGLNLAETTLAQILKPLGYRTMCVGKWHLGRPAAFLPTSRGFDDYYGIPYSNDMDPSVLLRGTEIIESPVNLATLTRRYTEQATTFIRSARTSPFFLYMAHASPHIPLNTAPEFAGKSGMGRYGDVIQELDWSVGQVLAALADNGVEQNTLVMFTSDNGPWFQGSPGRLRGRKGDNFEGGLRVPFVARFPARILPSSHLRARSIRTIPALASALDIVPTVAAFTGAGLPRNPLDGVDIGPLMMDKATDVVRPPLLYFSRWNLQCIRSGPWKLHVSRGNVPAYTAEPKAGFFNLRLVHPELYNLETDPEEAQDLSGQHPDIVAALQRRIAELLPSFPPDVAAAWQDTQKRPVYGNEPGDYPRPILP